MRWEGERESENVEDRRGMSGGTKIAGGGIATLVIALIVWFMGGDPRQVLQNAPPGGGSAQTSSLDKATEDRLAKFVKVVLADTEDVWHEQFRKMNRVYREPTLVLFTGRVESACGMAGSATGPFYCPGDEKLYIDLSFYDELQRRFKAPGDFAQAYVVAHEVGHHIQKLLGTMDKVDAQRRQLSKTQANQLSVRLELQADFYAGVWAHHAQRTKKILEPGDLEEALRAATAIGDDAIQKQAQGYVVPDAFTHGTSRQRVAWFRKGFQTGDIKLGDTFNMPDPQ
jgi:predicted metalloprotease